MLSVVCWLWRGACLGGRAFRVEHVNVLRRMFRRHLSIPHRFICITDETTGFDPDIEVLPTPAAAAALSEIPTPEGARFPSCYRRLWAFSKDATVLGEQILVLDIDVLVCRDLAPIIDPSADFIGWRPRQAWGKNDRIGGGMYLLRTGARHHVWDEFRGAPSISLARRAGYRGSDQAWISFCLGATAKTWPKDSGLYSIRDMHDGRDRLPEDARLVQFNGPRKCWHPDMQRLAWVRQHYR